MLDSVESMMMHGLANPKFIEDSNSCPICSVLTISVLQHFAATNPLFLGCIACNGIVRPIARRANYTTWFIQRSVVKNFFFIQIKFL